jgi:MerR family transcriptional regulator, thiopeptide resistance regulator
MAAFEQVIPLLVYSDIQAAHDFLVQAFGFESGGVQHSADGQAVHGEVRVAGTTIWLHRVATEHALASPQTVDMAGAGLVIYVPDVDAHFARSRAAGARIDQEPTDQPYGQREYGARDPEGHRWWFATPTAPSRAS